MAGEELLKRKKTQSDKVLYLLKIKYSDKQRQISFMISPRLNDLCAGK